MTHQIIRFIVYGETKEEAREKAEENLNILVSKEHFDYGTFFDEEDKKSSGKMRYGELPICVLADSKEGKKLIDEGIKFTKEELMQEVKEIRNYIKTYSDEELVSEVADNKTLILNELEQENKLPLNWFQHSCYNLGCYGGRAIFLYDNDCEGIRNEKDLKDVFKWAKGQKVWVVPCDVHS